MNKKGFTLIEVLISLFIFGMVVQFLAGYTTTIYKFNDKSNNQFNKSRVAQSVVEELKSFEGLTIGDSYFELEELAYKNIYFIKEGYQVQLSIVGIETKDCFYKVIVEVFREIEEDPYILVTYIYRWNRNTYYYEGMLS